MEPIISGSKATLLAITENGFGKRTELDEYNAETHDEMYATRFVKVLHKGVTCFEM